MIVRLRGRVVLGVAVASLAVGLGAEPAAAQWSQQHEQFYLPAEHNWVFRRNFPAADRLFNAFDYGHAILYEKLYTRPDAPVSELEEKEYDFITRRLLVSPPRLPLEEGAIEIEYVKLVPEAKLMFEWAHILHRQLYDILGDDRMSQADKDRAVAEVLRYYKSRPDLAFSSLPKNMELMEGQYYSPAFREKYPKFNGLIWAYHWLQVGLYEPLMKGRNTDERQTGVAATVTRFRQMLENAPENLPRLMPMTAAIAPEFSRRYPEAAIIFDNLHGMHDVISDILASPRVPRERKREEILIAARRYRDNTSFVMTEAEWREMSEMMGVQNMGGPATGLLPGFPQPTVARGAVMAHRGMNHAGAGHAGMNHGAMQHGQPGATDHAAQGHAGMQHGAHGATVDSTARPAEMARLREMHERMMADPVIRERVATDPVLQRMLREMGGMHGAHGTSSTGGSAPHGAHGGAAAADSAQAADFIVRLLADPEIEARIHADPRLHGLWSDPQVQRRIAELRRQRGAATAAPAPQHQH